MHAIVLKKFGGVDSYAYEEVPKPEATVGFVLIEIKAFGINHAEMHMRRGEWAEAALISGIECVGIVRGCPGGEFTEGTKVAAVMGGLGRSLNGSYAQFTLAPVTNVIPIETVLSWADFAAIPESYAVAWTCLHRNLEIQAGQTLLIRGATSAFGQAAINLAVDAGLTVIATSRNPDRFSMLKELGAETVILEQPSISQHLVGAKQIDGVLDLIGNSTIIDSMHVVKRGGRACLAGWLGGIDSIGDFNPLMQMPSGVCLTFFGSFVFGSLGFPLNDVPLQEIVRKIETGKLNAKPARIFQFSEIRSAHLLMEESEAGGKMIVLAAQQNSF